MTKQPQTKEEPLARYFNVKELAERKRCVQALKNFHSSYEAAARALQDVKEFRLYRPHRTIREFCEQECGWTVKRLYQVVNYLKIKSKLPPEVSTIVDNEGIARELGKIPEEERETVLNQAAATGKVTAKKVKQLAEKTPKLTDNIIELDRTGWPIPEPALPIWNRRHEAEKILSVIRDARDMMQELMNMQAGQSPDPLYTNVSCNSIYAKLADSCRLFKEAIPYAVCTVCQGVKPDTCIYCKHRGMISKFHYDTTTPAETKEIRKKAQQQ